MQLTAVTYLAADPARVAAFWATLLDREVEVHDGRRLVPGDDLQPGLQFVVGEPRDPESAERDDLHLHLTSETAEHQAATVAETMRLGARHLDVGQRPEQGHVVLADPEGNELCVIEAGNAYLAGCGFLGEVACDGSRDVGLFWSRVLSWPLVWDQDEETAVQSPRGGTKVAWGGPSKTPRRSRPRQWFELTVEGPVPVGELVSQGAQHRRDHDDGSVEMSDPDGHPFLIRPRT